ncbi:hypothetical protein IPM19_00690 [bacterium]|nr:MAG: hypothetical protein IPM19_00690 [bacterium]
MLKLNSRIKLFGVMILFGIFAALMFTYGYGILENRNQARLDVVNQKNLELEVLKKEQLTYEQGKKDITTLTQKTYPPQDLFSKDTKVVKEIKILEDLAKRYSLTFTLTVSGTTKMATKVTGVTGELFLIPYTVTIDGAFNNIQRYIEAAEHSAFINEVQQVSISSTPDNRARGVFNAVFYLKP